MLTRGRNIFSKEADEHPKGILKKTYNEVAYTYPEKDDSEETDSKGKADKSVRKRTAVSSASAALSRPGVNIVSGSITDQSGLVTYPMTHIGKNYEKYLRHIGIKPDSSKSSDSFKTPRSSSHSSRRNRSRSNRSRSESSQRNSSSTSDSFPVKSGEQSVKLQNKTESFEFLKNAYGDDDDDEFTSGSNKRNDRKDESSRNSHSDDVFKKPEIPLVGSDLKNLKDVDPGKYAKISQLLAQKEFIENQLKTMSKGTKEQAMPGDSSIDHYDISQKKEMFSDFHERNEMCLELGVKEFLHSINRNDPSQHFYARERNRDIPRSHNDTHRSDHEIPRSSYSSSRSDRAPHRSDYDFSRSEHGMHKPGSETLRSESYFDRSEFYDTQNEAPDYFTRSSDGPLIKDTWPIKYEDGNKEGFLENLGAREPWNYVPTGPDLLRTQGSVAQKISYPNTSLNVTDSKLQAHFPNFASGGQGLLPTPVSGEQAFSDSGGLLNMPNVEFKSQSNFPNSILPGQGLLPTPISGMQTSSDLNRSLKLEPTATSAKPFEDIKKTLNLLNIKLSSDNIKNQDTKTRSSLETYVHEKPFVPNLSNSEQFLSEINNSFSSVTRQLDTLKKIGGNVAERSEKRLPQEQRSWSEQFSDFNTPLYTENVDNEPWRVPDAVDDDMAPWNAHSSIKHMESEHNSRSQQFLDPHDREGSHAFQSQSFEPFSPRSRSHEFSRFDYSENDETSSSHINMSRNTKARNFASGSTSSYPPPLMSLNIQPKDLKKIYDHSDPMKSQKSYNSTRPIDDINLTTENQRWNTNKNYDSISDPVHSDYNPYLDVEQTGERYDHPPQDDYNSELPLSSRGRNLYNRHLDEEKAIYPESSEFSPEVPRRKNFNREDYYTIPDDFPFPLESLENPDSDFQINSQTSNRDSRDFVDDRTNRYSHEHHTNENIGSRNETTDFSRGYRKRKSRFDSEIGPQTLQDSEISASRYDSLDQEQKYENFPKSRNFDADLQGEFYSGISFTQLDRMNELEGEVFPNEYREDANTVQNIDMESDSSFALNIRGAQNEESDYYVEDVIQDERKQNYRSRQMHDLPGSNSQSGYHPAYHDHPPLIEEQTGLLGRDPTHFQEQTGLLGEVPPFIEEQPGLPGDIPPYVEERPGILGDIPPYFEEEPGRLTPNPSFHRNHPDFHYERYPSRDQINTRQLPTRANRDSNIDIRNRKGFRKDNSTLKSKQSNTSVEIAKGKSNSITADKQNNKEERGFDSRGKRPGDQIEKKDGVSAAKQKKAGCVNCGSLDHIKCPKTRNPADTAKYGEQHGLPAYWRTPIETGGNKQETTKKTEKSDNIPSDKENKIHDEKEVDNKSNSGVLNKNVTSSEENKKLPTNVTVTETKADCGNKETNKTPEKNPGMKSVDTDRKPASTHKDNGQRLTEIKNEPSKMGASSQRECNYCKQHGHSFKDCPNKICNKCLDTDHVTKQCHLKIKAGEGGKPEIEASDLVTKARTPGISDAAFERFIQAKTEEKHISLEAIILALKAREKFREENKMNPPLETVLANSNVESNLKELLTQKKNLDSKLKDVKKFVIFELQQNRMNRKFRAFEILRFSALKCGMLLHWLQKCVYTKHPRIYRCTIWLEKQFLGEAYSVKFEDSKRLAAASTLADMYEKHPVIALRRARDHVSNMIVHYKGVAEKADVLMMATGEKKPLKPPKVNDWIVQICKEHIMEYKESSTLETLEFKEGYTDEETDLICSFANAMGLFCNLRKKNSISVNKPTDPEFIMSTLQKCGNSDGKYRLLSPREKNDIAQNLKIDKQWTIDL